MNRLVFRKRYWQLVNGIFKFRIYDTERGYVVITHTGDMVGIADSLVQAQQLATVYRG